MSIGPIWSLSACAYLPVDELACHLYHPRDMAVKILGVETSCDETAAAVAVEGEAGPASWEIRSSVIASQVEIHREWGGVVPELASRQHLRDICGVVEQALKVVLDMRYRAH